MLSLSMIDGHKPDLDGGEENDKPKEGVENADDNLSYLALGRAHKDCLQNKEENDDRAEGNRYVFYGVPKGGEQLVQFHRVIGDRIFQTSRRENAEEHNGEDGADGAKGDKAKAAFSVPLSAERCGHTDAERHDKGYGDRPRRYATRIKPKR